MTVSSTPGPEAAPRSDSADAPGDIAVNLQVSGLLGVPARVADSYVTALRRRHPQARPDQIVHLIQKQYLLAMGVGAAGTGLLSLRRLSAPWLVGISAGHLGACGSLSAFYLLCLARVYHLDASTTTHLLTSCTFGESEGGILEEHFAGRWWRTALAYLPTSQVRLAQGIGDRSLRRARRRGGVSSGAAALGPSIGAGLGFTSGRILGHRVIEAAHALLGTPPHRFVT